MTALKLDLFLFIGDVIYADTRDLQVMRKDYEQLEAQPSFRSFREKTPILAIWDDHDMGENDAGREYPLIDDSKKIFLEFFREPAHSARRLHPGLYGSWTFGPPGQRVQIILLDARSFRSPLKKANSWIPWDSAYLPDTSPNATILGDAQWKWLETTLQEPAELRILASSYQFVNANAVKERWALMPLERERLLKLLEKNPTPHFVISGDRHFPEFSRLPRPNSRAPLVEFTSSGMTHTTSPKPEETNPLQVHVGRNVMNFGLIEIQWPKNATEKLSIQSSARGPGGAVVFTETFVP